MKKIALWEVVLLLLALPWIVGFFAAMLHGIHTYNIITASSKDQDRLTVSKDLPPALKEWTLQELRRQ